jgi:hypothetical protein
MGRALSGISTRPDSKALVCGPAPHWRRPERDAIVTTMSELRDHSSRFTSAARHAAHEARRARANRIAAELAPTVKELQAAGITSLNGIAAELNARGIPTPAGSGHWYAAQVSRLLKRLAWRASNAG